MSNFLRVLSGEMLSKPLNLMYDKSKHSRNGANRARRFKKSLSTPAHPESLIVLSFFGRQEKNGFEWYDRMSTLLKLSSSRFCRKLNMTAGSESSNGLPQNIEVPLRSRLTREDPIKGKI
mmetsp:Transcript_7776/g.23518  ORF Transcript_7776/g.23518 Transcript_7776/m.23518 type:complete len:120 (+) Transcript_7776:742-1101(+)